MIEGEERQGVLVGLDLLGKLTQVENNEEALARVPDRLLSRLVELLWLPMAGCDILASKDGALEEVRADWLQQNCRVVPLAQGGSDIEVRDSSLELMSFLAGLSDRLRSRLGASPDCIPSLARIAVSLGGRGDSQARRISSHILAELATVESNHMPIRVLYPQLLIAASKDAHTADLLFNHLRGVFPD
ncbi:unnamed protein product [Discosporangium mesarthrocarpum]